MHTKNPHGGETGPTRLYFRSWGPHGLLLRWARCLEMQNEQRASATQMCDLPACISQDRLHLLLLQSGPAVHTSALQWEQSSHRRKPEASGSVHISRGGRALPGPFPPWPHHSPIREAKREGGENRADQTHQLKLLYYSQSRKHPLLPTGDHVSMHVSY